MSEQTAENDAARIERATEELVASRLTWGTHSDRWCDVKWQREFWAEAASIALAAASAIPPAVTDAPACDGRGPGGECVRDHEPCPDFPIPPGSPASP